MDPLVIGVVEDSTDILKMLALLLPWLGYRMQACSSVAQAMEQITTHAWQPDLLLLDLQLGGNACAGLSLLRTLRGLAAFAHVPAIVSSADHHGLQGCREELVALRGASLRKPFSLAQFRRAIDQARSLQQEPPSA